MAEQAELTAITGKHCTGLDGSSMAEQAELTAITGKH
jgi:hypothetical protein